MENKPHPELVAAEIAKALDQTSGNLVTGGMLLGPDRVAGATQWGYGDDRVVGLAVVTEIAAALAMDSVSLLDAQRRYSAAALVRQLIECEYLMWLFANNDEEARRWLNADDHELERLFKPGRIREQSGGTFGRGEYHVHCLLGGHPSPHARSLLPMHSLASPAEVQWEDLTLHLTRTWTTLIEAITTLDCSAYLPVGLADSVTELLSI
jgi:hypothetical protein